MQNKSIKFVLLGGLIVGVVVFLALTTFQESKSYFMNVDEVVALGNKAVGMPLKMRGVVKEGSIVQKGNKLKFDLMFNEKNVTIEYVGRAIIPDNFRPNIEAVVSGTMKDKVRFEANHIQAKCASKYEADYNKLREKPKS